MTPLKGERNLRERCVAVKNASSYPVIVYASAKSSNPNDPLYWDSTPNDVRIEPGNGQWLKTENGLLLRGSEVKITATDAKSEHLRWTIAQQQAPPGGYKSETMGTTIDVLTASSSDTAVNSLATSTGPKYRTTSRPRALPCPN